MPIDDWTPRDDSPIFTITDSSGRFVFKPDAQENVNRTGGKVFERHHLIPLEIPGEIPGTVYLFDHAPARR